MTPPLSHCAKEVRECDPDRFLLSLFASGEAREALLALYALNAELAHVHRAVREEMIGHIRYAWWQETLEKLYNGTAPGGQPVLQALEPLAAAGYLPQVSLMTLVESYRASFPAFPQNIDAILETLSLELLAKMQPAAIPHWKKAHAVLLRHRARHGGGKRAWLALKLLLAGADYSVTSA